MEPSTPASTHGHHHDGRRFSLLDALGFSLVFTVVIGGALAYGEIRDMHAEQRQMHRVTAEVIGQQARALIAHDERAEGRHEETVRWMDRLHAEQAALLETMISEMRQQQRLTEETTRAVSALRIAIEEGDDVRGLIAQPLVELKTASVTCATSATEIAPAGAKSMMIVNKSPNAVYVGGTNVDGSTAGTTGVDVCDGCTAGKTLSVDARRGHCVVASGTQSIEIVYGVQ